MHDLLKISFYHTLKKVDVALGLGGESRAARLWALHYFLAGASGLPTKRDRADSICPCASLVACAGDLWVYGAVCVEWVYLEK